MSSSSSNHIQFLPANNVMFFYKVEEPVFCNTTVSPTEFRAIQEVRKLPADPDEGNSSTVNTLFMEVMERANLFENEQDFSVALKQYAPLNELIEDLLEGITMTNDNHPRTARIAYLAELKREELLSHLSHITFNYLNQLPPNADIPTAKEVAIFEATNCIFGHIGEAIRHISDGINYIENLKKDIQEIITIVDDYIVDLANPETFAIDLEEKMQQLDSTEAQIAALFKQLHEMIQDVFHIDYHIGQNIEREITGSMVSTFEEIFELKNKWQNAQLGEISLRNLRHQATHSLNQLKTLF